MPDCLRIGVIGCGVFGGYHIKKYKELEALINGIKLTTVFDTNLTTRGKFSSVYDVEAVTTVEDLIDKVDMVSICTPAVYHYKHAKMMLEAGIHVLVEKPISINLREADELIDIAKDKNLVFTVGHQERFVFDSMGILAIPEVPVVMMAWREGSYSSRGTDVSVIMDLMIHDLDLVHMLIPGQVATVSAVGNGLNVIDFIIDVDYCAAALDFDNGTFVNLRASRIADQIRRGMKIVYSCGKIEIDFVKRTVINTTPYVIKELNDGDPLGESVANFVMSVKGLLPSMVTAEQAKRALNTALMIEEKVYNARS
jgi:predicted dehydrogenase